MAGQGNDIVFAFVEQAGIDTGVPATPTFDILRRTDGNIEPSTTFTQSDEVSTTRQGSEQVLSLVSIEGSINSELPIADTNLHSLFEGVVQGRFSTPVATTATTISFDNAGALTSTANDFAGLVVGQYIGLTGSTSNDGVYRITTYTDDNNIVVDRATVTEAAGQSITIKGSMLRNGKDKIGYTFQKRYPLTAGGYVYSTMEDCQLTSFDINFTTSAIPTISWGVLGLQDTNVETAVTGQSDNAENKESNIGPINGVHQVWIDNVPSVSCDLQATDLSISIDNGSNAESAIGCRGNVVINHDKINVTGTLNTHASGTDPLADKRKMLNETLFSLGVELLDRNGNRLIVTRDSTLYTALELPNTGNATSIMSNGTVSSDGVNNDYGTIQIDYIPA